MVNDGDGDAVDFHGNRRGFGAVDDEQHHSAANYDHRVGTGAVLMLMTRRRRRRRRPAGGKANDD